MAETAATTRPTRTRKSPATPAKAAPAKVAPSATAEAVNVDRFKVELVHVGATKQYEKFGAPDTMKGVVVGNLYAPLGTERMIVMVLGAGAGGEE